jgi:hypothetical protein
MSEREDVPCVELIWSRRGRSILHIQFNYDSPGVSVCMHVRGYALRGVLVCITLIDDVICAVDGFHRLERREGERAG